jgi:hypothetical protein
MWSLPRRQPRISLKEEAYQRRGRELTKNGQLCVSKALLGSCVPSLTADQVYAEYFKPFTLVDEDTNLSCLKSRPNQEKKIRNSMFDLRHPEKDPAFFNFSIHTDLNRLASVLEADIVIYYTNETFEKFFELYHDFRCFNNRVEIPVSDYEEDDNDEVTNKEDVQIRKKLKKVKNSCLYYVLTVGRKLYKFEESLDEVLERLPGAFFSLHQFRILNLRFPDYGELLARSLDLPPPPFPITSLLDLTFSVDRLWDFWKVKIILVSFCKLNFNQKQVRNVSRRMHPRFCFFFHLGIVAPPPPPSSTEADLDEALSLSQRVDDITLAVSFYGPNLAHVLKDEYRRAVIEEYKKTSRRDKPQGTNFLNVPSVSLDERREALAKVAVKKRLKMQNKVPYGDSRVKHCQCTTCKHSDKFDLNMGRGGPERLCTYTMCASELLKLLGADSEKNLEIIEQLCSLSMASMDIESMTMDLHLEPPVREGAGLFYGVVDNVKLQGHFKKVQKPVMIAHLDQLCDENDVKVFTIESDSEESIYKMMRHYWRFVVERHKAVKKEKFRLAKPLFELILKFKNAHFEFCGKWCVENSIPLVAQLYTRAYCQSLVGQLEKKLLTLIYEYTIFSFYG